MPSPNGNLLTAMQVKEILNVSRAAVYKMKDRGTLPYVIIEGSKAVRFRPSDVQKVVQRKPARKRYTRKKHKISGENLTQAQA